MIPVLTQPCLDMSGYQPLGVVCAESNIDDSYASRLDSVKLELERAAPEGTVIFFNLRCEDRRSAGNYPYIRATADAYARLPK